MDRYPWLSKILKPTDLEPLDKMSVDAGRHYLHSDVIDLLSEKDLGTKIFFEMIRDFVAAFEDPGLTVEQKIENVRLIKEKLKAKNEVGL